VCASGCVGPPWGTAETGGIYSSVCDTRTAACACCVSAIGRSPTVSAGVTFTSRTTSAPWAARSYHTSVIDAAGAIYVIGGFNRGTQPNCKDVWVSTDGGADRTRAGVVGGVLCGYWVGTTGVLQGYCRGTHGVLEGTRGVLRVLGCTEGVLGTRWLLTGRLGVLRWVPKRHTGYQGAARGSLGVSLGAL
jgi:hypothetical protein